MPGFDIKLSIHGHSRDKVIYTVSIEEDQLPTGTCTLTIDVESDNPDRCKSVVRQMPWDNMAKFIAHRVGAMLCGFNTVEDYKRLSSIDPPSL